MYLCREPNLSPMSLSTPVTAPVISFQRRTASKTAAIPIYLYAVSLAALLTMIGILWDISWHRSIGRDKLLSPPHDLVYLGAIFAGLFSGIQVLWLSFFRKEEAKQSL